MISLKVKIPSGTFDASIEPVTGSMEIKTIHCDVDIVNDIKSQYDSYMAQVEPRTSREVLGEVDYVFSQMKTTTLGVQEVHLIKTI